MIKHSLFGAGLAVVLMGCTVSTPQSDDLSYDWSDKTQHVITEVVPTNASILNVAGMQIAGEYIYTTNYNQPDLFSCLKWRADSLIHVADFLKRGQGPYEMIWGSLSLLPESNRMLLIDMNTRQGAYEIRTDSIDNLQNFRKWNYWRFPETDQFFSSTLAIDSTPTFLVHMIDDREHMFGLFHPADTGITLLDLPYPTMDADYPAISLGMAFAGNLVKRPNASEYLFSAQNSRYVFTFKIDSSRIVSDVRTLYNTRPRFQMAADGMNIRISGEVPSGYYVEVSKDHIYLTPRNYRPVDTQDLYNKPPKGEVCEVLVFDWDGKPVKKLVFEHTIRFVSVDPADRYLYAKTTDPESEEDRIIRVDLQSVFNN